MTLNYETFIYIMKYDKQVSEYLCQFYRYLADI